MHFTPEDKKIARAMLDDYRETGSWYLFNLGQARDWNTGLSNEGLVEALLRLGNAGLIKEVNANRLNGEVWVTTFGKLTDAGVEFAEED